MFTPKTNLEYAQIQKDANTIMFLASCLMPLILCGRKVACQSIYSSPILIGTQLLWPNISVLTREAFFGDREALFGDREN